MKKLVVFLVIIFLGNIFQFSSNRNISGVVKDKISGKPIKGVVVQVYKSQHKTKTDVNGKYVINVPDGYSYLLFKHNNYLGEKVTIGNKSVINVTLSPIVEDLEVEEESITELLDVQYDKSPKKSEKRKTALSQNFGAVAGSGNYSDVVYDGNPAHNTESYDKINENKFKEVKNEPLSTFSIDVDRASYSNVRRFLNSSQMPYKDAVRIEEMINYFDYNYPQPKGDQPFSVNLEMGKCPWNSKHNLIHIGLKGKELATDEVPATNLVFLLDVSGSMNYANKLPLLKSAFKVLLEKLRAQDRVAIVVYAGAAGLVLKSTPGNQKEKISRALDLLSAGGSTAGGAGIKLAYKIAKENFIKDANNRVILATDGDFNIGASSDGEMVRLIEEKRNDGIFLTVLGFGMGNYKDSKMEQISNAGNGNYAYIDNILEAKKTLGKEIWGTLFTIAKDVKIQIEFNPAKVKAYRLIGYENRMLAAEDFNDDKKDAGEIGAGHTVTALYEVIPADSDEKVSNVDSLEYQTTKVNKSNNLMTLKLRYKEPDGDTSKLIKEYVKAKNIEKQSLSDNFRFAAAVAEFGMLLRDSEFKQKASYENVISVAKDIKTKDEDGFRAEFIKLVEVAELVSKK